MDRALEFERVSVSEARGSFESGYGAPEPTRAHVRAAPAEPATLASAAREWLAELPADVRPVELAAYYPRIANELSSRWRKVAPCEQYLDELVFDRRGGRTGFPRNIGRELASLRDYYLIIHPKLRTDWDFVE
jgi:hypothetical protein